MARRRIIFAVQINKSLFTLRQTHVNARLIVVNTGYPITSL
jgi:hypothetical protein